MSRNLFAELKRRNVFKACIAYVALGWVVTQVTGTVQPMLHLPEWTGPFVLWIGVIGFPFVVMFSWVYELTPEGLKRESEVDRSASITHVTGRRLDHIIIGLLVLAIGLFAFDRFAPHRGAPSSPAEASVPEPAPSGAAPPAPAAAPSPAIPNDNSIAVLPFVDMSQGKDQEYFSDGISEELLNLLAKIQTLHVAARTSSFSFKGQNIEIPEIARRLHVANVLEGSIRKAGDQVRITAQLIRAADGYHVWSETWDRRLDDIFKIQDEIAGKVVEQLKVSLLGAAPRTRTTDPKAYALYLQAHQLGSRQNADAFRQSDALYRQALAIDPNYAPAWDGLSENSYHEASISFVSSEEGFARAREAAEKALAIDPDYAQAYARLGFIAEGQNDVHTAAKQYERALALEPGNPRVLNNAAGFLMDLGRLDEAQTVYEALTRRDPVNVAAIYNLGYVQRLRGRLDDSLASMRTVLSLSPGRGGANYQAGVALLFKGDAAGALKQTEEETSENWRQIGLPMAFCALGRKAESEKAFSDLIAKFDKDSPYNIAYAYAFCGNPDKAFEWLDKTMEYKDPGISEIPADNLFANIRSDPRWLPFLRKVGKAPEQLAAIQFKVTLPKEWHAETTASATVEPTATSR